MPLDLSRLDLTPTPSPPTIPYRRLYRLSGVPFGNGVYSVWVFPSVHNDDHGDFYERNALSEPFRYVEESAYREDSTALLRITDEIINGDTALAQVRDLTPTPAATPTQIPPVQQRYFVQAGTGRPRAIWVVPGYHGNRDGGDYFWRNTTSNSFIYQEPSAVDLHNLESSEQYTELPSDHPAINDIVVPTPVVRTPPPSDGPPRFYINSYDLEIIDRRLRPITFYMVPPHSPNHESSWSNGSVELSGSQETEETIREGTDFVECEWSVFRHLVRENVRNAVDALLHYTPPPVAPIVVPPNPAGFRFFTDPSYRIDELPSYMYMSPGLRHYLPLDEYEHQGEICTYIEWGEPQGGSEVRLRDLTSEEYREIPFERAFHYLNRDVQDLLTRIGTGQMTYTAPRPIEGEPIRNADGHIIRRVFHRQFDWEPPTHPPTPEDINAALDTLLAVTYVRPPETITLSTTVHDYLCSFLNDLSSFDNLRSASPRLSEGIIPTQQVANFRNSLSNINSSGYALLERMPQAPQGITEQPPRDRLLRELNTISLLPNARITKDFFSYTTPPIVLEGRNFGRFLITCTFATVPLARFDAPSCFIIQALDPYYRPEAGNERVFVGYTHPNLSNNKLCFGNVHNFCNLMLKRGSFGIVIDNILTLLCTGYRELGPFSRYMAWPVARQPNELPADAPQPTHQDALQSLYYTSPTTNVTSTQFSPLTRINPTTGVLIPNPPVAPTPVRAPTTSSPSPSSTGQPSNSGSPTPSSNTTPETGPISIERGLADTQDRLIPYPQGVTAADVRHRDTPIADIPINFVRCVVTGHYFNPSALGVVGGRDDHNNWVCFAGGDYCSNCNCWHAAVDYVMPDPDEREDDDLDEDGNDEE